MLLEKRYSTFKVVGKGGKYKYERYIRASRNHSMEELQRTHTRSLLYVLKNKAGEERR